jgi:hypothetical protein
MTWPNSIASNSKAFENPWSPWILKSENKVGCIDSRLTKGHEKGRVKLPNNLPRISTLEEYIPNLQQYSYDADYDKAF